MNAAETVNIAAALAERARLHPEKDAILFRRGGAYQSLTFRELDAEAGILARGLERSGLRRGTRTVLMVRPGPDFFSLTFALFKLGAVPVFVDPGMGKLGLGRCLEEAAPEAFIGIPLAHAGRLLLGWARRTLAINIVVGPAWLTGLPSLDDVRRLGLAQEPFPQADTAEDETAAILFTSGSTGSPKGAVYTHGNFAAQVAFLRDHFRIGPDEIDLPTFPLFALFDAALGMTAVIPEMDFTRPGSVDPKAILGPIAERGVTHMFGSPALLDKVGRWAEGRGRKLPSLRRVVSAGAPVAPRILERFSALLSPGAEIHTPYGATEALPVASIASGEILGETRRATAEGRGVCVGRPLAGLEVSVIRLTDEPLPDWSDDLLVPPGEIGEIVVRGPNVTREYFGRPEATRAAKIRLADGSVAHRMGDVGYLDPRGRLWFCGRKTHRVTTPAGTLFTIPCEGVFNQHPKVRRTALVGVGRSPSQSPVLVVEPERGVPPSQALEKELLALGAARSHTRDIRTILFHPSLPVDIRHNAKIFREKLAVWAERKLS